ncbi:MAG TPA: DinB family protein [Candidatus Dormibacteraeota bacterium]|jgi:hypothetical protein
MDNVLDAARRVVSTTAARWRALVDTVPAELLERAPAPGEWSAADCLRHLLATERRVMPVRIRQALAGEPMRAFDPQAPEPAAPEGTPGELADAFVALRRESDAMLARVTPDDLDRTADHPEYGPISLRTLLNVWAAHDLQHTVQAEEALMQAFLPDTGPFRFRFADHEVG